MILYENQNKALPSYQSYGYNKKVSDTKLIMNELTKEQHDWMYDTNYFESDYCQSVLDASSLDIEDHYVLSDTNVIKLLHDHGADVNEWKEDCKRYNDPQEILMWLGY